MGRDPHGDRRRRARLGRGAELAQDLEKVRTLAPSGTSRRRYVAPTVRLIGRGVEQTLLERAREVARAAGAGPGSEPDLGAPDLPRALEELAAVVWLIDAARRRDHRFPPPGPG